MEALFVKVGIAAKKAKEAAANPKLAEPLAASIGAAHVAKGSDLAREEGLLLYELTTMAAKQSCDDDLRNFIAEYIGRGDVKTTHQLRGALGHVKGVSRGGLAVKAFEEACGVGVCVSEAEINAAVAATIEKLKDMVMEMGKRSLGGILKDLQQNAAMKWANAKLLKQVVDAQLAVVLKDHVTVPAAAKTKKKKEPKAKKQKTEEKKDDGAEVFSVFNTFHKPGENHKTDKYPIVSNTMELLKEHVARTGGEVRTRFPPEPNGILHIGHAKAMFVNFSYAKLMGGSCIFRYDDTNPAKEEERFYTGIKDILEWLGHDAAKITHTSDYFPYLHDCAVKLIKDGHAYVCHQSAEEVAQKIASPFRDRPVEESLYEFQGMRMGKFAEGEATLRMKHTMEDGKMDPIAYRISYHEHFRTGNEWCMYPSYDFSHSLIDSIEDISHSMCTKEFQNHRPTYFWVCNAADVYCPVQWEYGRLELSHTITSKRKIQALVEQGIVLDWDDPRLYTLMALRRRGFPPQAINKFCQQTGLTGANATMEPNRLEACIRDYLNERAPRRMVVMQPVKVTIVNWDDSMAKSVQMFNLPVGESSGVVHVPLSKELWIERADYSRTPDKGYRRLTSGQAVGLKYANMVLTLVEEVVDAKGELTELKVAAATTEGGPKPKAFVHWVAAKGSVPVEIRTITALFNSRDPLKHPDGFLADLNPNSLTISEAVANKAVFADAKVADVFQFERQGYYCLDRDSTKKKSVFNLTVTLKEDSHKKQ